MYYKIYLKHMYSVYALRFLYITAIFSSLIFVLNILEEMKFFGDNPDVGIGYPILLTFLNLPSILFEIFPFVILITTQFFFLRFQNNNEILIFKNNGINNLKIINFISLLVFFIGIIIISVFHFFSSNMKYSYLEFKNKYTKDNKYLAVINENGLWIKDRIDDKTVIIHSEKIKYNKLQNIVITTFDEEFRNEKNIIANEAIIDSYNWDLKNAIIVDSAGSKETFETLSFKTNFDYIRINSLFSNLESLNIFQLFKQKKDFEKVGMTVSEIEFQINKILSLPVSLVIFATISSILMLNVKLKNSKTFMLITGILMSVVIYYIYYFFGLMGTNNKVPILIAIWMPNLLLFLICLIGLVNINEK